MTAARAWHPPWPGFEAGASLVLPLPTEEFAALDADLHTDGLVLTRKREFHVTLLDRADEAPVAEDKPAKKKKEPKAAAA